MFDLLISNFSFNDLWNPSALIMTIIISLFYLWMTESKESSLRVPLTKRISFLLGMFLFYFGFSGPLYLLGHLIFTAHMVQMAICYLIVPPLLIIGMPNQFLKFLLSLNLIKKILSMANNPLLSLLLFNVLFSFYHFPVVLDYLMVNYTSHLLFQSILFVAAILMWWPILNPFSQLSELKKIGYMFANGVLLTPACALIIFSSSTLYGTYTDPVIWSAALGFCLDLNTPIPTELFQSFSPLSPKDDQQLGGVVMKLIQELVYGITIAYIVIQWIKKEKISQVDPI